MNKWFFLISLLVVPNCSMSALAHGAKLEYSQNSAIIIRATYDDGTPMTKAQVVIYSPVDRATPWQRGTTDEQGQYIFIPDDTISGNWDVKVRQAGHGDITSIALKQGQLDFESSSNYSGNSNYSPVQKMVMAAMGVWGFIGTALFFSRSKSAD